MIARMTELERFTTADAMAWVAEIKDVTGPREVFRERSAKEAGDNAEKAVHRLVQTHPNFEGARIFDNKRVPLRDTDGKKSKKSKKGEIDILIVTEQRIYVLEVKDWSGRLEVDGDHWLYTPRSQEAEPRETEPRENWIEKNRVKAQALVEYLRGHGLPVSPDIVTSRILFMNDKIDMVDEIARHPDVIVRHQLESYFAKQPSRYSLAERVMASLIRWLFDKDHEALAHGTASWSQGDFRAACEHIATLRTFDKVVLCGGRQLPGDIEGVTRGGEKADWASGEEWTVQWPTSLRMASRQLWRAITEGQRPLWGVLKTPRGLFGIHQMDGIRFREVGQKASSWIPFTDVERVMIG
jgi:hypothetical protein